MVKQWEYFFLVLWLRIVAKKRVSNSQAHIDCLQFLMNFHVKAKQFCNKPDIPSPAG